MLSLVVLLLAAAPNSAYAQFYDPNYGYNNGNGYGTRIGIGAGAAAAVALIILAIGCVMRKRRARAFKNAYPVQPNNASTVNYGQEQGIPMQNQQPVPQYQQQPSFQEAPAYNNYRPDASNYHGGSYAAPPASQSYAQYAPPTSPPPAASPTTYAPPPGPPPPEAYDPTNVQNK